MQRIAKSWLAEFWKENRILLLFIGFVVIPVKSSLADWNWVPTGSMKPNILEGDLIFINKAAYDVRVPLTLNRLSKHDDPKRGDIVVCLSPEDGTRLVKRVVAVPGDTIELRHNHLYINDQAASFRFADPKFPAGVEPRLRQCSNFAEEMVGGSSRTIMETPSLPGRHRNLARQRLQAGQYYLMGDNRDNSRDSREFGPVGRHLILGKATNVLVSFNKLDGLKPRFGRWLSGLK